jgi:CheY-like chemotaxis protein
MSPSIELRKRRHAATRDVPDASLDGTATGVSPTVRSRAILLADFDRRAWRYNSRMDSDADRPIASRPALAGVRVLVVDDNEDARAALQAVLEAEGAFVATASSSDAALTRLNQTLPDVMLVDISMPIVNGFELVEQLRRRPAARGGRVPAAALTGYISAEDRARALGAGFQAYLTKPVDPTDLIDIVRSLARERQADR